jgi:hypothetical protein
MLSRRHLLTLAGAATTLLANPAAAERVFRFEPPNGRVIVTNPGLVATDPSLPHIEELERRLHLALCNDKIVEHLARGRSQTYVLSSVTLSNAIDPEGHLSSDFQTMLEQQSEFISTTFGILEVNDLPIFAATSIDNDYGVIACVSDVMVLCTLKAGFWGHRKSFNSFEALYVVDDRRSRVGALELVVLWPILNQE